MNTSVQCLQCPQPIEAGSNYCPHCGSAQQSGLDLFVTGSDRPAVSDKGYLLVAVVSIAITLIYLLLVPLFSAFVYDLNRNLIFYRVLALLQPILMYSILFRFAQKPAYRTTIAIIGAISILSSIYTMFLRF